MTDTRDQRIHAIVYSNDSREELGERIVRLEDENAKLRELVAHYERAVTVHDAKPVEVLEWSVRCDALRKELGIEVDT